MSLAQCRKWQLTINNFNDIGLDVETVKNKLSTLSLDYWCLCQEIGNKSKILHMHVFMYSSSPIRFSTIQRKFDGAHIENCRGSCKDNRDYILKQGKYLGTDKEDTVIDGSFEEFGELPKDDETSLINKKELVVDLINSGYSNEEIIKKVPTEAYHLEEFDSIRQTLLFERFKNSCRPVDVTYIFGKSGTGKTSYIFRKYGYKDVYRITSYQANIKFDDYCGQDILVFEEFDSQIPIKDMLNLLDIYPLDLPARYHNRTACYTKVFITSNEPLQAQYKNEQEKLPETYKALLRRVNRIYEFKKLGEEPSKIKDNDPPNIIEYAKEKN